MAGTIVKGTSLSGAEVVTAPSVSSLEKRQCSLRVAMLSSLFFLDTGWSLYETILRWGHLGKIGGSALVKTKAVELTLCEHSFLLCSK